MKTLSGILLFVLLGIAANAQTPRVVAEIAAGSERAVKNVPFTAEAVSESVQTLADGNRIVRKWTNKIYRNSEGRFRREGSMGGSLFGTAVFGEPAVTIFDSAGGYRYHLDTNAKTARAVTVYSPSAVGVGGQQGHIVMTSPEDKARIELEAAKAGERQAIVAAQAESMRPVEITRIAPTAVGGSVAAYTPGHSSKYETRTESLGTQNIEGVEAEGTRTITTIPADAIGNERPIEIVYERWYSKELQQTIATRHVDPRFGEQTYRLTNINRSEPDPSLFEVPQGYRLQTEAQPVYRTAPVRRATVERTAVKATAATKP